MRCDHSRLEGYWGGCGACSPPENEVEMIETMDDIVATALKMSTLADALAWVATHENERAVKQAIECERTGESTAAPGQKWDTCFTYLFQRVLNDWGVLQIECSACGVALKELGGLLFDPPEGDMVKKRHLCVGCMLKMEELLPKVKSKEVCYLIINGSTINSFRHEVSYEMIVDLAGLTGEPSMTCSVKGKEGFTMKPGSRVKTRGTMIFSVMHTGNA